MPRTGPPAPAQPRAEPIGAPADELQVLLDADEDQAILDEVLEIHEEEIGSDDADSEDRGGRFNCLLSCSQHSRYLSRCLVVGVLLFF